MALMTHLRAQLPPDAHETRLRAALQLVPSSDAAHASGTAEATVAADDAAVAGTTVDDHDPAAVADANAALVMLMEGALKITAGGAHAPLLSSFVARSASSHAAKSPCGRRASSWWKRSVRAGAVAACVASAAARAVTVASNRAADGIDIIDDRPRWALIDV